MKALRIFLALVIASSFIASIALSGSNYYSKDGQDPTVLTSWSSATDGSGTNPTDFASGDSLIIQSSHSMTLGASWAISGGTILQIRGILILGGWNITVTSPAELVLYSNQGVVGILFCGTNLVTGTGSSIINGTINIGAATGIGGNIQTTTKTFNSSATYIYSGTAPQSTGTGLPSQAHVVLNNSNGLTLDEDLTLNRLIMTAGSIVAITHTIGWDGSNPTLIYNGSGAQSSGVEFPTVNNSSFILSIDNSAGTQPAVTLNIPEAPVTIGSLELKNGNFTIGTGSFAFTTVEYSQSTQYTTTDKDWPLTGGPSGVIINNPGGVILHASRSNISGLVLQQGAFDLNSKTLTLVNGALIRRSAGTISAAPAFGASVNVRYENSSGVSVGNEMPADGGVLLDLRMEGSGGLTLTGPITVNAELGLSTGKITTTSSFILKLASTSTCSGGGPSSYVNGPVRSIGTGSFIYPVGKGATYTAVHLNSITGASPEVDVELFNLNPSGTVDGTLDHISSIDYWKVSLNSGSVSGVVFQYTAGPSDGIQFGQESNLRIARSATSNGQYVSEGGNITGSFPSVTVTSNSLAGTDFGYFTLGSATASNPLPVQMSKFTVTSKRLSAVLDWTTATEVNCYGFDVERKAVSSQQSAVGNSEFTKIGFVKGAGTSNVSHAYSYSDQPGTSGSYSYRIKQVDNDGTFEYYSPVESEVGVAAKVLTLGQNYPNPFNPSTKIEFTLPQDGHALVRVFNTVGQVVATLFDGVAQAGRYYQVSFDASKLSSGVYYSRLDFNGNHIVKKLLLVK